MKRISNSLIRPIVVPKASEVLAERLRNLIVQGHFSPGDMLPTERDLVVEAGLSRTSVRDALRVLESEGLITTRAGRTGGSIVTLPGRDTVARSVELFVRTHGVRLASLLECRVAIEPTNGYLPAVSAKMPPKYARASVAASGFSASPWTTRAMPTMPP